MQSFSNEQALIALFLTTLAGMSTGLGGLLAFSSLAKSKRALRNALSFAAGVMICVSFVEMLPSAYDNLKVERGALSAVLLTLSAFLGGTLLVAVAKHFISLTDILSRERTSVARLTDGRPSYQGASRQKLMEMSLLTAIAIALHNFPEGVAVFMTNINDLESGLVVTFAILLHNIPEGIAVAVPVMHLTGSGQRAFSLSLFSGLTEPIGALLAFLALYPFLNEMMLAISLAAVSGIMVFISIESLLPMAFGSGNRRESSYSFLAGTVIMVISLLPNLLG